MFIYDTVDEWGLFPTGFLKIAAYELWAINALAFFVGFRT
jgi:hypothetical protein